jgi:group I intron endonuclease
LYNSLVKHGFEKHKVEVIHQCSENELNDLEIYYIDLYSSFNNPRGMNLCSGGNSNRVVSEETRIKMSESLTGELNPFYGKKHSEVTLSKLRGLKRSEYTLQKIRDSKKNITEETRKRMSEAQMNKNPPSNETRRKMSIAQIGRKHSEETKRKISNGNGTSVIQYTKNGEVVGEYKSVTHAAMLTGIKRTTISYCVNGRCKTSKGFVWKKIIEKA